MKLYFSELNEEFCMPISAIKALMKEQELSQITLTEAKVDIDGPAFYCKELEEISERHLNYCGKICKDYNPRNGKSGRCKYHSHTYTYGEKSKVITIKKSGIKL